MLRNKKISTPPKRMGPFFSYYGAKWSIAPLYPKPLHDTIIEPFAGSATYSILHYKRKVKLYDANPFVVGVWQYLISSSANDIRKLPIVKTVDDAHVCQEAKWLIGFHLVKAGIGPSKRCTTWVSSRSVYDSADGWCEAARERIASQVSKIKHWTCEIVKDYSEIENANATWFIDPPYNNKAGKMYPCQVDDYVALGDWCKSRLGQVMVCENEGADWLPFRFLVRVRGNKNTSSNEVVWIK